MNNDRAPIIRPVGILLTVLAAATGYFIVGPHVSATALYVGTAVAIAAILGVGYLMAEIVEVPDEVDQNAERWGIAADLVVIAIGVITLPLLADGIVQAVAHLAITFMLAWNIGGQVYHAKARNNR